MANRPARIRQNGRRQPWGGDYVALALIAIAAIALAAVALSGISLRSGETVARTSIPAPVATPTVAKTPTPTATPLATVSLLGDRTSAAPGSWWKKLTASPIAGVAVAGSVVSMPSDGTSNTTVAELQSKIDATTAAIGGYVIVQAGSAEVADGTATRTVAAAVQNLWKAVSIRGGIPIVALLAPSDGNAERVTAVNELLAAAASAAGYPVLDLHTAVAAANGTWAAGYSDDGAVANDQGSRSLAAAAATQLPELLRTR